MNHTIQRRTAWIAGVLAFILTASFMPTPTADVAAEYGHFGTPVIPDFWPTGTEWIEVPNFYDPKDAGLDAYPWLDFVGDATDPCFFRACKTFGGMTFLFFRMRVRYSGTVTENYPFTRAGAGSLGVLVKYNSSSDHYPDYGFFWDAQNTDKTKHGLEFMVRNSTGSLWKNITMEDADGDNGKKVWDEDNELLDFRYNGSDGYIRTVDGQSTSNFGVTTFVDFAVFCDFLSTTNACSVANLSTKFRLLCGQSWQFQLASIPNSNDHGALTGDIGNGAGPESSIAGTWSASTVTRVELGDFGARYEDRRMRVAWETLSEADNAGFHL